MPIRWWWALMAAGVIAGCLLAGLPGCGFDSTWALVWAGDLLHGSHAAQPQGVFVPTPHPASIGLASAIHILGGGHDGQLLWAASVEASLVALLSGVVRLGYQLSSRVVGCAACIGLACLPVVVDAVGNGTIDVFFAACCVWALCLASSRPGIAIGLAALAALARPEGILLGAVIVLAQWAQLSNRQRMLAVAAATAVVLCWVGLGAVMFGSPLAVVHITANNGTVLHDNPSLVGYLRRSADTVGPLMLLFAAAAVLYTIKPSRDRARRTCSAALTALLVGLTASVVSGTPFAARYLLAEIAIATPLAAATLWRTDDATRPARTRLLLGLIITIVVAVNWLPLLRTRTAVATQQRDANGIASLLRQANRECDELATPDTALLPVIELRYAHALHIDSTANDTACTLSPNTLVAAQAGGFGPLSYAPPLVIGVGKQIATGNGWTLYAP